MPLAVLISSEGFGLAKLQNTFSETKQILNWTLLTNTGATLEAHRITLRLPLESASRVELAMIALQ